MSNPAKRASSNHRPTFPRTQSSASTKSPDFNVWRVAHSAAVFRMEYAPHGKGPAELFGQALGHNRLRISVLNGLAGLGDARSDDCRHTAHALRRRHNLLLQSAHV